MGLTHRDLALLTAALYADTNPATQASFYEEPVPTVNWDYRSSLDAVVVFSVIRVKGYVIVVDRGSKAFMDWVHDIVAVAQKPVDHPEFGLIHIGFYSGVVEAVAKLLTLLKPGEKLIFAGHSLGAAHVWFMAATMLLLNTHEVSFVCTWGSPRPGFQTFTDLVKNVPRIAYDNYGSIGYDPVPELPWTLPGLPYKPACDTLKVTQPPSAGILSSIGPQFGWHHFANYLTATPATPIS